MRIKILTERPMGLRVAKWLVSQGETIVIKDPELQIICYYGKILKKINIPTINFHPGFLPINRGMHPQYWPLIDGSPAGVALHWVVRKVDCGPIIARKRVKVAPTDIASDMDRKTQEAIFSLFKKWWPRIKKGKAPRIKQGGRSSRHFKSEIAKIHEFPIEVVNKLRANTFEDRSYAFFRHRGKKIYFGIKFYG